MPDLVVDLDGLSSFAGNLGRIRERLARAGDELRGHDDVLGHEGVAEALEGFEDRWRDGREKIESNCEALGSMVDAVPDVRMEGLAFRLKGADSLECKIASDLADDAGATADDVAQRINDAVRYTYVADDVRYADTVADVGRRMQDEGFTAVNPPKTPGAARTTKGSTARGGTPIRGRPWKCSSHARQPGGEGEHARPVRAAASAARRQPPCPGAAAAAAAGDLQSCSRAAWRARCTAPREGSQFMTTTYYRVYYDADEPHDRPKGLYRREHDAAGRIVASEAYHPRTGWSHTDYWLRTARGEPDKHLVEVDEEAALETVAHFDVLHARS